MLPEYMLIPFYSGRSGLMSDDKIIMSGDLFLVLFLKNYSTRGWRNGSAVKSTGCPSEGPGSITSIHMMTLTTGCNSSRRGSNTLFWLPKSLGLEGSMSYIYSLLDGYL